MTIKYDFSLNNPNLPQLKTLAEQMADLPNLAGWYQAQDDFLDVSGGRIVTWTPRIGSAPSFAQANNTLRADIVAGAINGWAAAEFRRSDLTLYRAASTVDLTGACALAVLWKPSLDETAQGLISTLTDSTHRFSLAQTGSGQPGILRGYLGASAVANASVAIGEWQLAVIEKDASQFRVRNNGTQSALVSHDNEVGTDVLTLGCLDLANSAAFDGQISDFWIFDTMILGTSAFDLVRKYVSTMYGVDGQ